MFIRIKKRKDIISVGDSFMNLKEVTDELFVGTVKYTVNQVNLIQDVSNAGSIVRVTFSTKNPKKDDPVKRVNPHLNPGLVPKVVATLYRDSVEFAKNLEKSNVLQLYVDSTSKVNNQLISSVKTNRSDLFNAVQMRSTDFSLQTVKQVGDTGIFAPILQTTSVTKDDAADFEAKKSLKTMLITERKDPSQVIQQSVPQLTPNHALNGTFSRANQVSSTLNLFYKHIIRTPEIGFGSTEHFSDEKKVLVLQSKFNNEVYLEKDFSIPISNLKNSDGSYKTLFVFFEVIDRFGVSQQVVEKLVDLSKSIEVFQTPKLPPTLSIYKNEKSLFGSLRISQQDPQARFVNLYRKNISHISSVPEEYIYADQFDLSPDEGERIFTVDVPAGSTIIYRAVPVGVNGVESFEYSNIVITSKLSDRRLKYASLAYTISSNGIELEIREVSPEAISFDVIRKDRTIFDSSYSIITSSPILVESGQTQYKVVDSSVKKKHVYEYAVKLHFRDGRSKNVGNIFVEYIPSADNVVDTKIKNLTVTFSPEPNVTFDLETNVISTDVDTLTRLLEQNNLLDFFSTDILKERSKLNELICYEVHRQDLTTGIIENFGIISDKSFSDEKFRVVNSVAPLRGGRQYRYVVTTLLRSPETLFEEFVKDAVDSSTKKKYSYKPFKFFQPITLERGSVTTSKTLKLNHAKEPFAFGNVGSFASAEVSFEKAISTVTDVKAETGFDDFIVIKWKYDGSLEDVDHFIVMKEFQGFRTMLGKSHALGGNKTFQYIKKISDDDAGELEFIVVPIFSDYQLGKEVKSNQLTVTK